VNLHQVHGLLVKVEGTHNRRLETVEWAEMGWSATASVPVREGSDINKFNNNKREIREIEVGRRGVIPSLILSAEPSVCNFVEYASLLDGQERAALQTDTENIYLLKACLITVTMSEG